MKKFIVFTFSIILSLTAFGQAQIDTKKVKIADFTQKITKVVLSGNMFYDATLKSNIAAKWHISPFEFCTLDEYNKLCTDDSYYFLLTTNGQFKREVKPEITFLTLVKGGKDADKGIENMLEVVSFPFAPAEDPSGREYVFLPVILNAMQNYIVDSMDHDINGYIGLTNYTLNISKSADRTLVFSEGDISPNVSDQTKNACFDEKVLVLVEEDADKYVSPEKENTLVSYVVAPSSAKIGSYCYKMLFDPQDGTLYYFRKHKISKKYPAGFLAEDLKRITTPRKIR
jgi:hypothetical protein